VSRAARVGLGVLAALAVAPTAHAQDSTPPVEGVRVGITYTPGSRPRVAVLPGAGLDSVRAILRRDLDYSDRFELIYLEGDRTMTTGAPNYPLFRTLGAQYGVEVIPQADDVAIRLYDMDGGSIRQQASVRLPRPTDDGFRFAVHDVADEVVRWITGTRGIATTKIAYVGDKRLRVVDSDGADAVSLTGPGETVLSPAWSPDGRRLVYTRFAEGTGTLQLYLVASGTSVLVAGTRAGLNYSAAFSPDGRTLAYARSDEGGTDIYTVNVADMCCTRRLTAGRFADNLSPTYSPDGRRIAFVSTQAGPPQIYVMSADGTDQELLAPFDFGVTGSSFAPEWSPDGASLVFHRQVAGAFQIFVLDIAARRLRQLTSVGRNEDPSWAPDGRHIVFVSDRSGRAQLWVMDVETGRVRQVSTGDVVRLPSWSRSLGATVGFHH